MKRSVSVLLCAVVLAAFVPALAFASNLGNMAHETSLTVLGQYEGRAVSGSKVNAYRVAGVGSDGAPVPVGEFASYSVLWDVSSSSSQQALANALEGYILREKVVPTYSAITDESGRATFPPNSEGGMIEGWYLILVDRIVWEDEVLETQPALIHLVKGKSQESSLKMSLHSLYGSGEYVTIDAMKVWRGDPAGPCTPVSVQLLCDGDLYETVELNEANGWHYAWKDLPAIHRWTIMEENVPGDYLVSITKEGDIVTLVNTFVPPKQPEVPESGGGDGGKLPQTGGFWWPVPLLLAAGAAFFVIGILRLSREKR